VALHVKQQRITADGSTVRGVTPRADGPEEFAVRREHRPDAVILWLSGSLDRATSSLLDHEVDAEPIRTRRVIVDLTELQFIDSGGLATLERLHQRACENGDRLSFRRGAHVAQRPLELTRTVQLRSRWVRHPSVSHEDSHFALTTASVDVDHPRPGDRPGAA
jgi:anti-anti-sigma factor